MIPRAVLAFAVAMTLPNRAQGIDNALGVNGAQVNRAKTQFALNGAGVNLGQVEPRRPGDPQLDTTVANFNHPQVNPGGAAVGVADINIAPPSPNTRVGNHATQVAGVMTAAGAAGVGVGVAPNATLFSSSTFGGQPFGVTAAEWVRTQGGGTRIINMSYGEVLDSLQYLPAGGPPPVPAAAQLDGNNLLSLYIDLATRADDMLFVIAGNEDAFNDNPISIPVDAFNGIVVGATSQRAGGGRFDQVTNFNTSNQTVDGRTKTDIVAPGGSNVVESVLNTLTLTRRAVHVFPPALGPNEVFLPRTFAVGAGQVTFNAAPRILVGTSDPQMPSLIDNLPAGNPDGFFDATGVQSSRGTSFAAPIVSGTLGLMQQRAANAGLALDHLQHKAAVLNGASKHMMSKIPTNPAGFAAIPVPPAGAVVPFPAVPAAANGVAWPIRYNDLNGAAGVVTTNFTQPLDAEIGVGQVNAIAALRQLQPAARDDLSVRSGNAPAGGATAPIGLFGGRTLQPGSLVVATMTWDRVVTAANNDRDNISAYGGIQFENLSLELIRTDGVGAPAVVANSNSAVDNVEHLYFNVPQAGAYALRVQNAGANDAPFGLAFSAGSTDGLSFSVAGSARGLTPLVGRDPAPFPNDVNSLGTEGPASFQTKSEIFVSGTASTANTPGMNMQRVSGALGTRSRVGPHNAPPAALGVMLNQPGVLGLATNDTAAGTDDLAGLSWGHDGTLDDQAPAVGQNGVLVFSVAGSGELRKSRRLPAFGAYTSDVMAPANAANSLFATAASLGLAGAAAGPPAVLADDLDALELDSPLKDPDGRGPITAVDPDGDGLPNLAAYFTLRPLSPSLGVGGRSLDDIFISTVRDPSNNFDLDAGGAFGFNVFADGVTHIGLQAGDIIDALVLSDIGTIGTLDRPAGMQTRDSALFSLATGSPSLAGAATGGDVFFTRFDGTFRPNVRLAAGGSLYARAQFLGIVGSDLDALDIARVPEPGTLALAFVTLIGVGLFRAGRPRSGQTGGPRCM